MQVEEQGKGSVPWAVYSVYIQALGGLPVFFFILALFVLNVGSTAFSNWWLSYWIKQGSGVRECGRFERGERHKAFPSVIFEIPSDSKKCPQMFFLDLVQCPHASRNTLNYLTSVNIQLINIEIQRQCV